MGIVATPRWNVFKGVMTVNASSSNYTLFTFPESAQGGYFNIKTAMECNSPSL